MNIQTAALEFKMLIASSFVPMVYSPQFGVRAKQIENYRHALQQLEAVPIDTLAESLKKSVQEASAFRNTIERAIQAFDAGNKDDAHKLYMSVRRQVNLAIKYGVIEEPPKIN